MLKERGGEWSLAEMREKWLVKEPEEWGGDRLGRFADGSAFVGPIRARARRVSRMAVSSQWIEQSRMTSRQR